ncbi:MAG: hypothetical protein WCV71_04390 [Patescibacteria group bacterium]
MINFSRQQNIFSQFILLLIILANMYFWQSSALGIIFGFFYLWLNSKKISDIFAENIHQGLRNIIGLITILAYISIVYTLAYHIYQINSWVWLFTLISIPLLTEISSRYFHTKHYFFNDFNLDIIKPNKLRRSFLPLAVFCLDIILFVALFKKASLGVIRSPWELVSYKFWAIFVISNICLTASLIDKRSYKNILLISWHFLLLSSMAIILYPLGYGYDSFIHNAALKIINQTGTIEPRLFLYIGQYGLSFFSHDLLQISLATANKVLLPFLFALLWPSTLFYGLRYGFSWTFQNSYLATLWSLFIGFSFAIMTTPQSLSYLLAAIFIFLLPEINRRRISLYFPLAISLMTITIHPLTGMPLLFFTMLLAIWRQGKTAWWPKIIKIFIYTLSILILPSLFAVYQKLDNLSWLDIFHFKLWPLLEIPQLVWLSTYSFPLDMLYNLQENKFWLYTLIILFGIYFIFRENKLLFFKRLLIFTAILIANYLITTIFLSFNLQIDYQKNDYINRISFLITLFFLPIFLTALYFLFNGSLKNNDHSKKILILIVTVLCISFGTYFSYPVYDRHGNSKSFNVTSTDIKTVELIEADGSGQNYIVLANQMVGAAAIDTYGFAHYYNNNFYYSMPLGTDNIYQNFLEMIENNASRDQALVAMDKVGVDKLYFVVNNYWHSAKQAMTQATLSSNDKISVDNGINTVFIYNR